MADLENDLKVSNWLGILTYDAFKYATVGGLIEIRPTDEGLALVLVGVSPSQEGVNKKFRVLVESMTEQGNCVEHEQLSN